MSTLSIAKLCFFSIRTNQRLQQSRQVSELCCKQLHLYKTTTASPSQGMAS
jgi:hypothetical protein